ncbi:hypothetical protein [Jatrophihabitans fulvus]
MAMAVHLNRPPHSVRLHGWGRATTGWWGCVSWVQRVHAATGDDELGFAAWVPAACLSRPSWSSDEPLPRIVLPDDSRLWPAPRGWPSWYAGVWLDGEVACPPGVRPVQGAAWRNRPTLAP